MIRSPRTAIDIIAQNCFDRYTPDPRDSNTPNTTSDITLHHNLSITQNDLVSHYNSSNNNNNNYSSNNNNSNNKNNNNNNNNNTKNNKKY